MRKRYHLACLAGAIGLLLLLGSACSKSFQTSSGMKSGGKLAAKSGTAAPAAPKAPTGGQAMGGVEPSHAPATVEQPPGSPAISELSAEAPGGGTPGTEKSSAKRAEEPEPPSTAIPSLSSVEPSEPLATGKGAGEQKIPPQEIVVAKADSSDAARRRAEEIQRDQLSTAAAGLEDVFFAFDSWQLTAEGKQALMLDAEWMKANPTKRIMIEGHCDERGTAAYNLVLGEKRAKAVQNFLVELGVASSRLAVVSYGKERPFCKERDETCYRQNRRGHIVVRAQ